MSCRRRGCAGQRAFSGGSVTTSSAQDNATRRFSRTLPPTSAARPPAALPISYCDMYSSDSPVSVLRGVQRWGAAWKEREAREVVRLGSGSRCSPDVAEPGVLVYLEVCAVGGEGVG